MENQSLNTNAPIIHYDEFFIKILFAIIAVYFFTVIIHFFREKYLNKESGSSLLDLSDLLTILERLFIFSGVGFIIAHFVNSWQIYNSRMTGSEVSSEWQFLNFGIIVLLIGLGLKTANNSLDKK